MLFASQYMNQLVVNSYGLPNPPKPMQVPPIFYLWGDPWDEDEIKVYLALVPSMMEQVNLVVNSWRANEKRNKHCTDCDSE